MAGAEQVTVLSARAVVADAGPLIALSKTRSLALLQALFGAVHTSKQVRDEVLGKVGVFAGQDCVQEAINAGWLQVHPVDLSSWRPNRAGVDAGEAGLITLAAQSEQPLLIMDDRVGRAEARLRGIALIGVADLVGLAKTQGVIPEAKPLLLAMCEQGYFLGEEVLATVLAKVGEGYP